MSLLSFKNLPKDVFDAQLGFNMLARYGEEAPEPLERSSMRIERHLASLLASTGDGESPCLRCALIQAPVFHGHSFSAWVEFERTPAWMSLAEALADAGLDVRSDDRAARPTSACAGQGGIARRRHSRRTANHAARVLVLAGRGQSAAGGGKRGGGGDGIHVMASASPGRALLARWCPAVAAIISRGRGDLIPKTVRTIAVPAFGNERRAISCTAIARRYFTRIDLRARTTVSSRRCQPGRCGAHRIANEFRRVPDHLRLGHQPRHHCAGHRGGAGTAGQSRRRQGDLRKNRPRIPRAVRDFDDPAAYFDESGTAMERLSKDVARAMVSALLNAF